jgi:pyruvate formate lyase activating enzyme
MKIGGIVPFTTVDYPDSLSAVLFCQGCPWRCLYCHNPHLQSFSKEPFSWDSILKFLKKRKGFLDAVVFSGGEPTMQKDLSEKMKELCFLGFKIGLHTSGIDSDVLEESLPWCDWVGMDLKAPFSLYEKITGVSKIESVKKSARLVIEKAKSYEFRTTANPQILSLGELFELADELVEMGAKSYVLQRARLANTCGQNFYDEKTVELINSRLQKSFSRFIIRF